MTEKVAMSSVQGRHVEGTTERQKLHRDDGTHFAFTRTGSREKIITTLLLTCKPDNGKTGESPTVTNQCRIRRHLQKGESEKHKCITPTPMSHYDHFERNKITKCGLV